MAGTTKPIKLWGEGGPNPIKVSIIFEELEVPYENIPIKFSQIKNPEYLAINPNGRLPAIQDPNNNNLILWESGAIIEYLVERYDTKRRLSFTPGTPEAWHAKQWLFFQVSGQGPYYGQASWFKKFHPEPLPKVLARYVQEANRVSSVLEGRLSQQKEKYGGSAGFDGPWLVGNKMSFADISFTSWQAVLGMIIDKETEGYNEADFALVHEWVGKMALRESSKKVWGKVKAPEEYQ